MPGSKLPRLEKSRYRKDLVQSYMILHIPYTVKKFSDFSVPSRDVTYQTLPGRE